MSIDLVIDLYSGFQFPGELRALNRTAASVVDGVIVAIGSYRGQTDCALALHAQVPVYCIDARIESIDDPVPFGDADRPFWMRNILDLGLAEKVRPVNLPSTVVASVWSEPIGLLFIDASHDYASVAADIAAWLPHVVAGGLIAFHDNNKPGVMQAVQEVIDLLETVEICDITSIYRLRAGMKLGEAAASVDVYALVEAGEPLPERDTFTKNPPKPIKTKVSKSK